MMLKLMKGNIYEEAYKKSITCGYDEYTKG